MIEVNDVVVLDYIGYTDAGEFDYRDDFQIKVEENSDLIGMKIGQEKDIDYVFPLDYRIFYLRGKPVTFHVVIKEIQKIL